MKPYRDIDARIAVGFGIGVKWWGMIFMIVLIAATITILKLANIL